LRSLPWFVSDESRDPPRRPIEPDCLCDAESEYDPDSERPDEDPEFSSPLLFARRDPLSLLRLPLPRDPEPRDEPFPEFELPPRDEPDEPAADSPEPDDDEAFFAVFLPAFLPDVLAVFLEAFFFDDFVFRVAPPD
jgi:hypothetical protein